MQSHAYHSLLKRRTLGGIMSILLLAGTILSSQPATIAAAQGSLSVESQLKKSVDPEESVVQPMTVGKYGCYLATPAAPYIVIIGGQKYMRASAETWCDTNKTIKLGLSITGSVAPPSGYPLWTINATAGTHYTRTYDNPCSGTPSLLNRNTTAQVYDSAGTFMFYNTSSTVSVDCRP